MFCKKCLQGYHIGECLPKEEQLVIDITGYSVDPKLVSQVYNLKYLNETLTFDLYSK